jgi:hypothetical protein
MLSIPESSHEAVERLVSLDDKTAEQLLAGMSLKPHCLDLKCVFKQVSEKTGIARPEADELVRVLLSMYMVRYDQDLSVSEMISELRDAIESMDRPGLASAFAQPAIQSRFERLLSLESSFGMVVKGMALLRDHPCHFNAARIITDARPIFLGDVGKGPESFLVRHTLKLEVRENGEEKEWYLALDSDDLERLRNAIDRALAKEKTLTSALKAASFDVLRWDD